MPATHYFLGNRLLGSTNQLQWWTDSKPDAPSRVFVCPLCGDAWARVLTEGQNWMPVVLVCAKHPPEPEYRYLGSRIPGSLIPPWRVPLEQFPLPVLRREVVLRYEHLKKLGEIHDSEKTPADSQA